VIVRLQNAIRSKEDEGFTLIELLVVIIIIGILAAIAIPVFLSQRQKGYDAQAKSDARNAATIEETYLTDYNVYTPLTGTLNNTAAVKTANPNFTGEGFSMSTNDTNIAIRTYPVGSSTGGSLTAFQSGGYCITTTSTSTKNFYYSSAAGGFTNTACS
jgi:type IV pilus assembly protein PilA